MYKKYTCTQISYSPEEEFFRTPCFLFMPILTIFVIIITHDQRSDIIYLNIFPGALCSFSMLIQTSEKLQKLPLSAFQEWAGDHIHDGADHYHDRADDIHDVADHNNDAADHGDQNHNGNNHGDLQDFFLFTAKNAHEWWQRQSNIQ